MTSAAYDLVKRTIQYLKANRRYLHILVVSLYVLTTASYMGSSFSNCSSSIYGFGDSTAGPIWKLGLEPKQPLLGGRVDATNYPYGESLYSPVGYAVLMQSVPISILDDVVGPICAYNLFIIIGYVSTALIAYFFIYYLTKSRLLSFISGYAIAFTPYVQSKVGGHPSYAYAGILIVILWLLIHFINKRKLSHGVALSGITALACYFDPYYIFYVFLIYAAFAVYILLEYIRSRRSSLLVNEYKKILIVCVSLALLLSPLAYLRVSKSDIITNTTSSVRGNVMAAAQLCSNYPLDYVLPDPYNIYLVKYLGQNYTEVNTSIRNWCGSGESRVSVSIAALLILFLASIIHSWEKINNRKIRYQPVSYKLSTLTLPLLLLLYLALIFGLPPLISGFRSPTYYLLSLTETWRILSRQYILVNISLVFMSILALNSFRGYATRASKSWVYYLVAFVFFAVIRLEYQINPAFMPPVFDYKQDVPEIYLGIRDSSDVGAVAEYPLDRIGIESDAIVYYLTMQSVHGKNILNSASLLNPSERLHNALKDLRSPQTLPALRKLGITHIVVHGDKAQDIANALGEGVEVIRTETPQRYSLRQVRVDETDEMVLLRIKEGASADFAIVINNGYIPNKEYIESSIATEYEVGNNVELGLWRLRQSRDDTPEQVSVCFDVRAKDTISEIYIRSGDGEPTKLAITTNYSRYRYSIQSNQTLELYTEQSGRLLIDNLGCAE